MRKKKIRLPNVVIMTLAVRNSPLCDSITEDFIEGGRKDFDGDGKRGNLGDRWSEMKEQGHYGSNPQIYPPGGTSISSLDYLLCLKSIQSSKKEKNKWYYKRKMRCENERQ